MTPFSDMDLIFINYYDEGGPAPLDPSRCYARLCPSGNAGTIASHLTAFAKYHEASVWTSEHMALARTGVLSGDETFTGKIEAIRKRALTAERDPNKLLADIAERPERIDKEHHTDNIWRIELIRGGLVDIELIIQYLLLLHAQALPVVISTNSQDALQHLEVDDRIGTAEDATLRRALSLWQSIQGLLCLTMPGQIGEASAILEALKQTLAHNAGEPDFQYLEALMADTTEEVFAIFYAITGAPKE